MDLGIAGKWALVCAASKGLGKGCAAALAREGVNLVVTARGNEALQATAAELRTLHGGILCGRAGFLHCLFVALESFFRYVALDVDREHLSRPVSR